MAKSSMEKPLRSLSFVRAGYVPDSYHFCTVANETPMMSAKLLVDRNVPIFPTWLGMMTVRKYSFPLSMMAFFWSSVMAFSDFGKRACKDTNFFLKMHAFRVYARWAIRSLPPYSLTVDR